MSSTTAVTSRLGDPQLDAAAGERGVDRVVVAVDPENGCCGTRTTWRRSRSGIRAGSGRIRSRLLGEPLGRDRPDRAVHPLVGLLAPACRTGLGSRGGSRTRRPGSKFERINRCERSSRPFACGSPGLQDHPPNLELAAEPGERIGRTATARRSRPRYPRPASPATPQAAQACGRDPTGCPAPPCEKISVPANDPRPAQLARSRPSRDATGRDRPGSCSRGSHRSHCTNSPGR